MRVLLSALVAVATFGIIDAKAPFTDSQYEYTFTKWIKHHNKVYAHDEFFSRFHIFKSNLDKIYHHNHNGNHSYTLSMNQFGDMTQDEFKHTYNGFHGWKHQPLNHHQSHHLKHVQAAESVDWRTKAAVTPVKNQGQCGACWSFSTTGAIEGAHAIATGTLISLSEQQLLDCDDCWRNNTPYCNSACNGGLMDKAFQWIIHNDGITGEDDQPYIATTQNCSLSTPIRARITGYTDIPIGDEVTLLKAVNIGPVSIGIEADQTVFQFYSGGVLDDVSCGTSLDHGVLIVGYGTDTTLGKDYWIVKNSWGATWGEKGYVRLVRNKNQCGLANAASYPTGAH